MDIELVKAKIESDIKALDACVSEPTTAKFLKIADEQSEVLLNVILEHPVHNLETFFAREQAFGHLRGLRHVKNFVQEEREDLQDKLNDLPQ